MIKFFAKLSPCLVGMEACGSAHHWARELTKLGHTGRLIPARAVKPCPQGSDSRTPVAAEHRRGWIDLERGEVDFHVPGQETNKRRSRVPIPRRLLPFLLSAWRRTRQYVIEHDGRRINDVKKSLATAGERAGLGHIHPHALRHTAVSWLVQDGVDLWQVGQWVGLTTGTIERVTGT